jgi:LCP family protein required for cell wall assembly
MDNWRDGWTRSSRRREEVTPPTSVMPARSYDDAYGDPYDPYAGYDRGAGRPGRPPRRRRRWGRRIMIGLVTVVLLLAAGYVYLDFQLQRAEVLTDYAGRPADTPGTNWLIVGSDSRQGLSRSERRRLATGRAAGKRTDTMMLLHIPEGDGQTTLLSLPRDSYLQIPGRGYNKLNAAFAFGGAKLLVRTVEGATGIRIDHYAEIGLGGFVGMVDAVGGVDLCVKQPIRDPKAGLNLKSGCQELNGGQALGYVRTRASARADLDRVKRQRQFFSALIKKATGPGVLLNPFRSIPLATQAAATFSVDEGDHLHHLLGLAFAMRDVTGGGGGLTATVPIGGEGSSPAIGSFIRWDPAKAPRLFRALRQDQKIPRDVIQKDDQG